jgi:hypothetical protein
MDSVSAITNLVEVGCGGECRDTLRKEKRKFILIYIISSVTLILLSVNTILLEGEYNVTTQTITDCIQWKCENFTIPPKCPYVDKYPLGDEVYVRVCQFERNVTLDIRHFKDGEGTGNGVQINKMQWQYLKNSIEHIDASLLKSFV